MDHHYTSGRRPPLDRRVTEPRLYMTAVVALVIAIAVVVLHHNGISSTLLWALGIISLVIGLVAILSWAWLREKRNRATDSDDGLG